MNHYHALLKCYIHSQGTPPFCPALFEDAEHPLVPGSGWGADLLGAGDPGPTPQELALQTFGLQHPRSCQRGQKADAGNIPFPLTSILMSFFLALNVLKNKVREFLAGSKNLLQNDTREVQSVEL